MGCSVASSRQEETEHDRGFTKSTQASAGWLQPWKWGNKPELGRGQAEANVLFWEPGWDCCSARLDLKRLLLIPKSACFFQSNQVCFSANQLVDIFALNPHLPISKEHFRQICPAIIQQLLGNACESADQRRGGSLPTALESKTCHLMCSLYTLQSQQMQLAIDV